MAEPRAQRVVAAARRREPRLVFWLSWALLTALAGTWALSNPMGASPDEPSHIVKAAALVREHTLGTEVRPGVREVELPRIFALTHEMPGCYAFRSSVAASCWPIDLSNLDQVQTTTTTAANYNPLYYLVVGLPSVLPPSLAMLYLMRLMGALLASGLLAMGLRSVAELPTRRWTVAGVAVAMSPMVVFMNSTVNPNAVEASAGLALWLTLFAALRNPDPALVARRWWRAGFLVVWLVNAKAFSALFLAIIVLTVVVLVGWPPVRAVLTDRRSWPGLALGTVGSGFALGWIALNGAVSGGDTVLFPDLTFGPALDSVLRLTTSYYNAMIGRFGWYDTPAPGLVYSLVTATLWLLVFLALAVGRRRERLVLVGLGLTVFLVPVLLQVPQASHVGLPWQGRYLLAIAVGVPLLAAVVVDRATGVLRRRTSRSLIVLLLGAIAVVQLASFGTNLRRYVAGTEAPWFEPVPVPWHPPVPVTVLSVGAVVAVLAVTALLLWLADLGQRAETSGPST